MIATMILTCTFLSSQVFKLNYLLFLLYSISFREREGRREEGEEGREREKKDLTWESVSEKKPWKGNEDTLAFQVNNQYINK